MSGSHVTSPVVQGLSEQEAQARRAAGQGNTAQIPTGRTYAQIIRENVFTFINDILFLLGLALAIVGRPLDALISVGVISINVVVGVAQEIRAKRTLDRITLLTRPAAAVIRDGQERAVPPEELVVGDVLRAGPGDQIVLDGEVAQGRMQVDESQLTGESDLIPKQAGDKVYSGSFCVNGGAHYSVEKVGTASLANQIAAGARSFRRVLTPLQRQINLVIRIVLLIVIYLQLLLIFDALVNLTPFAETIGQATILAGLVPNGLFLSIAVAYALAAVRIVRLGALVQQPNAVESLSNVDTLCLDKTGTLTANRLQVSAIYPFTLNTAAFGTVLGRLAASAATHNKTSAAIAAAYSSAPCEVVAEVPFSSVRKWSAVAFVCDRHAATGSARAPTRRAKRRASGAAEQATRADSRRASDAELSAGIFALGAPEMLRPYLGAGTVPWETIEARIHALTAQGQRVLLVAHHPDAARLEDRGDESHLPDDMTPLGLVSLSDELRPGARDTLAAFIAAGVQPKIISGDTPETVAALARQAGLGPDIKLVSGLELDEMSDEELAQVAEEAAIFGRITPRQKERLVEALRAHGHYVAMIGDGVNDVLSLKKANLAIAMQGGSQATRAVADIVLIGDSFSALAPAVVEGQRILNGMQDILKLFLARISTIALVIVSSSVIGAFPIALRNGSVITLMTVGIPTIFLALWAQPGPRSHKGLVGDLMRFVIPVAVFSTLVGLVVFYGTVLLRLLALGIPVPASSARVAGAAQANVPLAQTALTVFLVYCGLLLILFVEPPTRWWASGGKISGDRKPAFLAVALMLVFLAIEVVPALRALFALQPLELSPILLIAAALVIWLLLVRLFLRQNLIERFLGLHAS